MFWKAKSKQQADYRGMAADLVPTPVMAVDRNLRVIFMNQAGAQVAGRTQEACIGVSCAELFRAEHCGTSHCRCRQAMDRKGVFTADQVAHPQNLTVPIRYTATPLCNASGDIIGAVEFVLDISKETEITKGIEELTQAALAGKLDARIPADKFLGNYRSIVNGVGAMMDAVITPIHEAAGVLQRVANRDLTARMTGTYQGDHARLKESLNQAVQNLDEAMQQVAVAVEQVAAASSQISMGSQTLAQGASEQASSLEEVSSSLQEMTSMTRQNGGHAKEARELSEGARGSANKGLERMNQLSEAMEKIKSSSDSTAKIVKTIDEIAFQTNLLALNAAVEAARAGDAGKGFAVVAEEVRNLAMRSAEAAKNTGNMIEESVGNAETGVQLNRAVLEQLHEIAAQSNRVGDVMGEIVTGSEQQDTGIEQISTAVHQINQVTQQNAASSEESASAAEELSGQAVELHSLVGRFRTSDQRQRGPAGDRAAASRSHPARPKRTAPQRTAPQTMIPLNQEEDLAALGSF